MSALDEAYDRFRHTGPEWGENQLTNHGPMAAEVLVRRGHAAVLDAWVDAYIRRLEDLPRPGEPITDQTWRSALGDGRRLGDWTEYFTRQVTERPWPEVLVTWWPRLLPGIAAGTTHGVIRVGHAVRALTAGAADPAPGIAGESTAGKSPATAEGSPATAEGSPATAEGSPATADKSPAAADKSPAAAEESLAAVTELAHGLAFWAARALAVPGVAALAGDLPPATALDAVVRIPDQHGTVANRFGQLAELPAWPGSVAALRSPADPEDARALLTDLVTAATLRYLTHGHASPVLLVHTATAPNAVLHTLPVLPEHMWAPSLAAVWATTAAIVSAYGPADAAPRSALPAAPAAEDPVSEVLDRAVAHGDEHVIKFTDTAAEVYARTGHSGALAAAVRIGTLITPAR